MIRPAGLRYLISSLKSSIASFRRDSSARGACYALVSHKKSLLVLVPPKCGCTSVIKWISMVNNVDQKYGIYPAKNSVKAPFRNIHDFGKRCADVSIYPSNPTQSLLSPDYAKYIVVRNPYARLVSSYLGNYGDVGWGHKRNMADLGYINKGQDVSFREFVNIVCSRGYVSWDPHVQLQVSQYPQLALSDIDNYRLLRFERLSDDFDTLCARHGIDVRISDIHNINKTSYSSDYTVSEVWDTPKPFIKEFPPYREFYCKEIRDIVYNAYKKDFELLGYDYQA